MYPDQPLSLLVYPDPRLTVASEAFTSDELQTGKFTFDSLNKNLAVETADVEINLEHLIYDMKRTAEFHNAAGLAANQVGVFKRLLLITIDQPITMINPRVVSEEGEQTHSEGCLSIPNYSAKIVRPQKATVEYQDLNDEIQHLELEGLGAAAIKHEIEHLDGRLFIDNLEPLSKLKKQRIENKVSKYLKQNFYPTL